MTPALHHYYMATALPLHDYNMTTATEDSTNRMWVFAGYSRYLVTERFPTEDGRAGPSRRVHEALSQRALWELPKIRGYLILGSLE